MSKPIDIPLTKYRDSEGNTYGVERTLRTGKYIVVRTNAGGHRKGYGRIPAMNHPAPLQRMLNDEAKNLGWQTV